VEYFSTGDVELTASELRDLGSDQFQHYFVKKLISMAMDRHDKEKEAVDQFCYLHCMLIY
jgi:hypothetical protein